MKRRVMWMVILSGLTLLTASCNQKKKSGSGAAVDPATECFNRGPDYRWENGQCVMGNSFNQNYDQNSLMQQCLNQGGQWINNQCQYGANATQCVQQPSFVGILQCIQQNAQSYQQMLQTNSSTVRGYNEAAEDLQTLSEKATGLLSQDLRTDMTILKKAKPCWDTTSMINQLRQMSKKLEFSNQSLQQQSQTFIDSMHQATREIQNRLNCPLKF